MTAVNKPKEFPSTTGTRQTPLLRQDSHLNLLLGLPLRDDPRANKEIPDRVPLIALQLDDLSEIGLGLARRDGGFRSVGSELGFFGGHDVAVACEFLRGPTRRVVQCVRRIA